MEKVNINDLVKVKLTEYGKEIYYHQYDNLNQIENKILVEPHYPRIDEDGYSTFQLWELMKIYGGYISIVGTVENNTLPFETTLIF